MILDDDTFWSWGLPQRNVVTTITEHPENPPLSRYVTGMTEKHADKAIRILNDVGALRLRRENRRIAAWRAGEI